MADIKFLDTLEKVLLERGFPLDIVQKVLETAQTNDVVEVVRCEKCRKRHTWECAMHYESEDGKEQYGWENDNDFCSWGERKDGDGNG